MKTKSQIPVPQLLVHTLIKHSDESLNEILRKFCDIEPIGIRDTSDKVLTPNDKTVVDQMNETIVFKNGRYELSSS